MDLTPERGVEHQVGWLCVPWRNGYGGWAFRGRSATSDTSGSECLEKGRGSYVGPLEQKFFKKLKGKVLRACLTPACLYGLATVALTEQQQQLGSSNNKNKEGGQKKDERPERGWDAMQPNRKIGEKQDEMGRPLGKDGCRQTNKKSRGEKTSRTQE